MPLLWDLVAYIASFFPEPSSALTSWQPGVSPLSTTTNVVSASIIYLGLVYGGQEWMKDRKPCCMKELFIAHNLLLSMSSLLVLGLMVEQVAPFLGQKGLHASICAADAWTPRLEMLYQLNYYMKYYELLDTLFLVAKKKKIIFLHVYHHPATALLCYVQLAGRTPVSWVPIVLNLGGINPGQASVTSIVAASIALILLCRQYKRSITTLQISQFVIDLFVVYYASWTGKAYLTYFTDRGMLAAPDCAGAHFAGFVGCVILSSYLVLFVGFYQTTYKKASHAKQEQRFSNENNTI